MVSFRDIHLLKHSHTGVRCSVWFLRKEHGAHLPSTPGLSNENNLQRGEERGRDELLCLLSCWLKPFFARLLPIGWHTHTHTHTHHVLIKTLYIDADTHINTFVLLYHFLLTWSKSLNLVCLAWSGHFISQKHAGCHWLLSTTRHMMDGCWFQTIPLIYRWEDVQQCSNKDEDC